MRTISGNPASRFSFGAMQFGGKADATASAEMYAACRTTGITFFDTAFAYTGGRSEEILGDLIRTERDDIFLATKCANRTPAGPETIEREFAESRRRLRQETVDLLYLHRWDPDTPLEASLGTLARFVREGSVRHVGVSNFAAWQVMKARAVARDLGIEIHALQPMYNLVKRQAEVEILPMAVSEGFAVCPYSPLGGGLLTGKYAAGGTGRLTDDAMYAARYAPEAMHAAAGALAGLAAEAGVHPATLAVAWVAGSQGVWGPIVSARSAEQLAPSLAAIDFPLDAALRSRLDTLIPAPPPANDRLEERA